MPSAKYHQRENKARQENSLDFVQLRLANETEVVHGSQSIVDQAARGHERHSHALSCSHKEGVRNSS